MRGPSTAVLHTVDIVDYAQTITYHLMTLTILNCYCHSTTFKFFEACHIQMTQFESLMKPHKASKSSKFHLILLAVFHKIVKLSMRKQPLSG